MSERLRTVINWARDRWLRVRSYMKLVAPCWLAILIAIVMSVAMLHPQTVDALAALAEERGFVSQQHLAVLGTLLIFSSSAWYITRALMYVRYDNGPGETERTKNHLRVVTWLPRILGVLPIVAVSFAFLRSRSFLFVIIYIAIAVGFLFLFDRRRRWLKARSSRGVTVAERGSMVIDELTPNLPKTTRWIVLATLAAAFLGLFLVIVAPVSVPTAIGPLGVIFLAGAGWVMVGSAILVYPSRRFHLPSLVVTLLVLAVIFGIWNDNHGITHLEGTTDAVNDRPGLQTHFHTWLDHRLGGADEHESEAPYPVFVVTAEGGGIRAAYWTAAVLNAITRQTREFPCHVFAISGVSGGSLGGAAYAARLADVYFLSDDQDLLCTTFDTLSIENKRASKEIIDTDFERLSLDAGTLRVELEALSQDFLSPVLAGMLFPDLVQRLLPIAFLPDRGSYLERSWEAAWPAAWHKEKAADNAIAREFTDRGRTSKEDNRFRQDFLGLWDDDLSVLTPSLFLNATRVETGERVIVSNIRLDDKGEDSERLEDKEEVDEISDRPFGFAMDLLDRMGGSVKLSQAVHFSARFTYLSPAATIEDRTNGEFARIVDGGYFENSGAATAGELINELQKVCNPREQRNCRIHVLIISNDVSNPNAWQEGQIGMFETDEEGSCKCADQNRGCNVDAHDELHESRAAPKTTALFTEVLSPVRALFATRSARGYLAEEQLFAGMPCRTYRAQLKDIGQRDIPLGWILSDSLRSLIESQATDGPTTRFVAEIVAKYWTTDLGLVSNRTEYSE